MTLNKKYTLASAVALSVVIAGFSSPVFNTITNAPSVVYAEDVLDQEQPKNDSPEAVKRDSVLLEKLKRRLFLLMYFQRKSPGHTHKPLLMAVATLNNWM